MFSLTGASSSGVVDKHLPPAAAAATALTGTDDSDQLAALGYKQELRRELTSFANFGVSFSAISILTGFGALLGDGLRAGGPACLVWGWVIVSLFTACVAGAMAEVCSRYPHAGGLYFWAARIGGPQRGWSTYVAWLTGWCNLLGQFAILAAGDFGLALMVLATYSIATGEPATDAAWVPVAIYIGIVVAHGCVNTFAIRGLNLLNTVSVYWHIIGTVVILIACLVGAPTWQSAEWVFTGFTNRTGWNFTFGDTGGAVYAILLSLLLSQFTLCGYDAATHAAEETHNAAVAAPAGVVMSVLVSAVVGWPLLIALLFCVQDYEAVVDSPTGSAIAQIFLDCLGSTGAIVMLVIIMGAMFFSSVAAMTSASRTMYAFARDGALPKLFAHIDPHLQAPVPAVWASAVVAIVLGLPYLGSETAFAAVTSLATVALSLSYGIPVMVRLIVHSSRWSSFRPGPFHLGAFSQVVAWLATAWVCLITVLFLLPKEGPVVTLGNMNWSGVELAILFCGASVAWLLGFGQTFHANMSECHDDAATLRAAGWSSLGKGEEC